MWGKRRKIAVSISLSLILMLVAFSCVSQIPSVVKGDNDPIQPPEGGTVEVFGDWTVNDTREYHNCTIILNDNLIVDHTGNLTFHNVTLLMNNSALPRLEIKVYGNFTIMDWDNNQTTKDDASHIRWKGSERYNFHMYEFSNFTCAYSEISNVSTITLVNVSHHNIFDSVLRDFGTTISLSSESGLRLFNNTFINFHMILDLWDCENFTISNNEFKEIRDSGMSTIFKLESCRNITFEDNIFNTQKEPIRISGGRNVNITNNSFERGLGSLRLGVRLGLGSQSCIIHGNKFLNYSNFSGEIINVEKGGDHLISFNFISSAMEFGIRLWNAFNCTVQGNDIFANGRSGIFVSQGEGLECSFNKIIGNNITNNKNGIEFYGSVHNNTVNNNSILGNLAYAILSNDLYRDARYNFFGTDNQTILNSLIKGNNVDYSNHLSHRDGDFQYINSTELWVGDKYLDGGVIINSDLVISNANITFNETLGPKFFQVNGNLTINNSIFTAVNSNYIIVYVKSSTGSIRNSKFYYQLGIGCRKDGFIITNSTLEYGTYGLYVIYCNNITVTDRCDFSMNTIGVYLSDVMNSIVSNSSMSSELTLQGTNGIYLSNCFNCTLDNNTITDTNGGIVLMDSINCTVKNSYLYHHPTGISAYRGRNNTFINLLINLTHHGIGLNYEKYAYIYNVTSYFADNNGIGLSSVTYSKIIKNTLYNCTYGLAFTYDSKYNFVYDNDIYNNEWTGIGFIGRVMNNTIDTCRINNNKNGFFIKNYPTYNIIRNCTFSNNDIGVLLDNTQNPVYDNSFYHNNFINNTVQVVDQNSNIWDNGYPSGGNYWDNYTGVDIKSGPLQDQPDSDGIGDTPFVIDSDSKDNYPLMFPFDYTMYNIPLQQGWNLISLPLEQSNVNITEVLSRINGKWDYIQAYDPFVPKLWKTYATFKPGQLNDLQTLNHRMGFWINIIEQNVTLTMSGPLPTSTSINLYAGWNLVGYPSLNSEKVSNALWGTGADKVKVCDTSEPYNIKEVGPTYMMKPGEGYWVHVPFDTVWVVDW